MFIELTLADKSRGERKVLQRVEEIGDIYMHSDGNVRISPKYMRGGDYTVEEKYEDIRRMLEMAENSIISIPSRAELQQELSMLGNWMKEHGYDIENTSGI